MKCVYSLLFYKRNDTSFMVFFQISDCKHGRYGPNCQHRCGCLNGGSCHADDGTCLCQPGFIGAVCERGMINCIVTIVF